MRIVFEFISKMGKSNCVFGCDLINGYFRPFHRFPDPVKQPELFAAWVAAAGGYLKETDPVRIRRNKRVCDEHFEYSQRQGRARIIFAAVPTVNLFRTKQTIKTIVETDHNYCVERYTRNPLEPSDVQPDLTTIKLEDTGEGGNAESPNSEEMAYSPASDVGPIETGDEPEQPSQSQHEDETELFSWQKENSVIDTDVAVKAKVSKASEYTALEDALCLYENREPPRIHLSAHDDLPDCTYRCNVCEGNIIGFRYSCVQCVDFDLCGACEARGAHAAHYVLRVPPHRPYEEEQAMLAAIRLQLLHDRVFIQEENDSTEVKEEETRPESRCEDPLSADHDQEKHNEGEITGGIKFKDGNYEHHLPRKRPRLHSQHIQNTRQNINEIDTDKENPITNDSDRLHDMKGIKISDNPIAQVNEDTMSHYSQIGTSCIDKKTNHIAKEESFSSDSYQSVTKNQPLDKGKVEESSFCGNKTRILIKIPPGANAKDLFRRLSARDTKRQTNRLMNKEVTGISK